MAHSDNPIITRFAPSPTGHLHVGGARTALFAWALARRAKKTGTGGRFVLRIEDTDLKRSSEEASRGILEDLAWLGLGWDDGPAFDVGDGKRFGGDERGVGPFYQAQRKEIYDAFVQRLVEADLAYPAFDTPEELDAMRAEAQAAKRTFVYRRPEDYDREAMLDRASREEHVVRFRMPPEAVTVRDEVLGDVTVPYEELDDFVIRKRDGMPTYHFAVVVDDELMGVTDVVRGQEHLNNTPRHVALIRALRHEDGREFRTPRFAHLPVIANPDNSKMSKRDRDKAARAKCREVGVEALVQIHGRVGVGEGEFHAWLEDKTRQLPTEPLERLAAAVGVELPEVAVDDFRRSGYLPEVLLNYLALLGWNSGEKDEEGKNIERFDLDWFVERFELSRVGKGSSKFDRAKLLSFNAETLQHIAPEEFRDLWRAWLERYEPEVLAKLGDRFELAAAAAQPRAKTFKDAKEPIAFALVGDDEIVFDEKAVQKVLLKGEPSGAAVLGELLGVFRSLEDWSPDAIHAAAEWFAKERELGMGKVAQPLRVAITGGTVSPGLGETLALVGKDATISRIERAVGHAEKAAV